MKNTLFQATNLIDDKYLQEAAVRRTGISFAVKRIAAVAAMLALILSMGFILHEHNRSPYLTIQANAVSSTSSQRIPIDYEVNKTPEWVLAAPPYRPPSEWKDQKLFRFSVYIHNIPKSYRTIRTDIEILYQDSIVNQHTADSHLEIVPSLGGNEAKHLTGTVYGWLTEDTAMTINLYVYKGSEKVLFQSQTVLITVDGGYVLEILASEVNENIDWSELQK